jgi:hypothetical protein
MPRIVLFDVDGRIPNLALMKLSTYYKRQGWEVMLSRKPMHIEAGRHLASTVFHTANSQRQVDKLRSIYGDRVEIGGTGIDLTRRLPSEVEACFPDYGIYGHNRYAVGFLTRGCNRRCAFCVVPDKEGGVKRASLLCGLCAAGSAERHVAGRQSLEFRGRRGAAEGDGRTPVRCKFQPDSRYLLLERKTLRSALASELPERALHPQSDLFQL